MTKNIIKLNVGDLKGNTNKSVEVKYYEGGSTIIPISEGDKCYSIQLEEDKHIKEFVGIEEITDAIISAKIKSNDGYSFIHNFQGSLKFCDCDTSKMGSMKNMFEGGWYIKKLKLDGLNTENISSMSFMFHQCKNIKNLDISKFDTHNVTNMGGMFAECDSLQNLDVSNFDTHNVTTMFGMFSHCKKLESLDLSNFDVSKVTDTKMMFNDCSSLRILDLSGWDFNLSYHDSWWMFGGCSRLKTIYMRGCNQKTIDKIKEIYNNDTLHDVKIITK